MFNPAKAADEIKKEYIGYISTTFHFRNPKLQEKFVEELDKTVSNGPFIEIKDSFKSGASIRTLIEKGVLSPLFAELERSKPLSYQRKLPLDRPLYLHQQKAIEKVVSGNNVVVSTGTGSGKTNCFLIPVINELLREKENGTLNDGVRAIFIYPMNALANDQIKGLREILMCYPDIRFGVYNGGTENKESDAIKLYQAMYANEKYTELKKPLPNEEVSRDKMKERPPHILFTNYAMLEHMLFRPGDDTIFSNSNFKYVVLDEAHVYAGAMGIETAFLMGRLKGRMNGERKPQFILTSATLGDGSVASNQKVVEFANRLTGCAFSVENIVVSELDKSYKSNEIIRYPIQLFSDLADEKKYFDEVLKQYGLKVEYSKEKEPEILYDLISSSHYYLQMRKVGKLVKLDDFSKELDIDRSEAVRFVALCAKARKGGKPLMDIRYHYFLKALDGCYLALDYPQSLSLVRKDEYTLNYGESVKMFEIAVCEDCGEIALVGRIEGAKLVRSNSMEDRDFFQIAFHGEADNEEESNVYYLCKSCGAIVPQDEVHNKWCTCGNTQKIKVLKLEKNRCQNCEGTLRHFNLGYDAATGVIATALYEQIPEYTYVSEETEAQQTTKKSIFSKAISKKKTMIKTGSQFLVFSDSRQGAAKFACFLTDSYKEFLRRRGIWNVVAEQENDSKSEQGVKLGEFVKLLENYYSSLRLFRQSNSVNAESSIVENRRNAWVAVLNEMYNCNRDTSLVSLGKISFEYLGNTEDIVKAVIDEYNITKEDAKNFLNYLAFEVVRTGAIITDSPTDINDSDREYLYFTPNQKVITKVLDPNLYGSQAFMPTPRVLKTGEKRYYHSNKLNITKTILGTNEEDSVEFLSQYWDYLVTGSDENCSLRTIGKGYAVPASSFKVKFGKNAELWKCQKCGKVTQFNMGHRCIQQGCNGTLQRLNSDEFCKDNYYAMLYGSSKVTPLFVKEHTAQLEKKDALDYQQQFIRKEINALSCSTTFEMGVDVGDLETVFLRNIPPLPSNYAQRVGRAGRSIDAAAFALTFARLSSHDFTFFDRPKEMINGIISPPSFVLDNEKILRRHVYAIALSLYLRYNPGLYDGNNAKAFINDKGYLGFIDWLKTKPTELSILLKNSLTGISKKLKEKYVDDYGWLEEFCGEEGLFSRYVKEYESNIEYLKKEYEKAMRSRDDETARVFKRKLERYEKNDLIDFLVRGNIMPKYGFPIDSVELSQNISSDRLKSLNLNRDLSVAIAEYAPSSEIVADGGLYTSRYIRKPIVNKSELTDFETGYIAECPDCKNVNYSKMPVGGDGRPCMICGSILKSRDFHKSIEPRAGFIAEEDVKEVPLTTQERKYKTEAIYIGDPTAFPISTYHYEFNGIGIDVESTANDSLVVKSTDYFYVCPKCGYSIAADETSKLNKFEDYRPGVMRIERNSESHKNPFGRGKCSCGSLTKYGLHHEFKTDVAKITFGCDTSDYSTMLSVMYALLNSFANEFNIERRDIKACLTYKKYNGKMEHKIIIYDAVPGGAGHSRRLVTENGEALKAVISRSINMLGNCECSPSCYRCLRNYENQKVHEILDREKALAFLNRLVED